MKNKIVSVLVVIALSLLSIQLVSCAEGNAKKDVKISIEDPENVLPMNNGGIGKTYISKNYRLIIVEPNSAVDYKITIEKSKGDVDPKMDIVNPNDTIDATKNATNGVPPDVSDDIKKFIQAIERNSEK